MWKLSEEYRDKKYKRIKIRKVFFNKKKNMYVFHSMILLKYKKPYFAIPFLHKYCKVLSVLHEWTKTNISKTHSTLCTLFKFMEHKNYRNCCQTQWKGISVFFFFFHWQLYLHSTPTLVLLLVNCPIIKMRSKLQYEEEFLAYYIYFFC